jgi:hypothetical protein
MMKDVHKIFSRKMNMKWIILWTIYLSMMMFPFSASGALPSKGDVDNSGNITLQDAIMAIRITSGMNAGAQVYTSTEVSGDNKIGTAEAIYILQCISGLRPACDSSGMFVWDSAQWDNSLWN